MTAMPIAPAHHDPAIRLRAPATLADLREAVADVAASLAVLPPRGHEGRRRARLLVDVLGPLVGLADAGTARVQDDAVVTLREVQVLQRRLARTDDLPAGLVADALARLAAVARVGG